MTRDELVASLTARLDRASSSESPVASVIDSRLVDQAAELARLVSPDDVEAAYLIAAVHWARHLTLPAGQDQQDRADALRWFARVFPVAPERIPGVLYPFLADVAEPAGTTAPQCDDEAMRLLSIPAAAAHEKVLDRCVRLLDRAVTATPAENVDRIGYLSHLVVALRVRYERAGKRSDLDRAVQVCREALAAARAAGAERGDLLSDLGLLLHSRYERAGALADLDEAVTLCREAVAGSGLDRSEYAGLLSNLGSVLLARYGRTGAVADLQESVSAHRQAVAVATSGQHDWPSFGSNLGMTLHSLYEYTGDLSHLDEAVQVAREVVAATPVDDGRRPSFLANLGVALHTRHLRTGALSDLDEALAAHRQAVAAIPAEHVNRPTHLTNLGSALQDRYERTGDVTDLAEAVEAARQAADAADAAQADHIDRAMYLSNLASALRVRFRATDTLADLDEAVELGIEAVRAIAEDHPDRALYLSNQAAALQTRAERTGAAGDADDAVAAARGAVDLVPVDHPDRAMYLFILGSALRSQGLLREDATAWAEASEVFRQGAQVATAAALTRVRCGRMWADLAADAGDWVQAGQAWDQVLDLLPLLVDRSLARHDRQHHLSMWAGFGPQAAAAAMRTGDLDRAWQVLEQGRGVLLRDAVASRAGTRLRRRHPDLAERADHLRAVLDAEPAAQQPGPLTADVPIRRRQAAGEWRELLAVIRGQDDFDQFGLPPTMPQLRQAGSDGVIVAINVTRHGCDALMLSAERTGRLPLPSLTQAKAIERANEFLAAVDSAPGPSPSTVVTDVLAWLWDNVTGPVLDHLGHDHTPNRGSPWPRLWWIPTGPLSVLPLHAAGHHADPPSQHRRTVLDRVVSSYAPTASMLYHTRQRPRPDTARPMVVGINAAAGHWPLVSAVSEASWVAAVLRPVPTVLLDADATVATVRSGLADSTWAHFACHAVAAPDPADSHLVLADGILPVRELSNMDLSEAWLAYLSACTTGYGGTSLLDESIHIASAFQTAGFAHVVATLWPTPDRPALRFAKSFYAGVGAGDPPALAVHRAVHVARARYRDPWLWAAYIHLGS